jgi:hypothetical protein
MAMILTGGSLVMRKLFKGLMAGVVALPLAAGQLFAGEPIPVPLPHVHVDPCPCIPRKKTEPPTYTLKAELDEDDGCELKLGCRKAVVTPCKNCCNHTGGGNIEVLQPDDNTIEILMTGAAVAYGCPTGKSHAGMTFDLSQQFKIDCGEDCKYKKLKLEVSAELIGLLRSHCKGGCAEVSGATATVSCDDPHHPSEVVTIALPGHTVCSGENLSVNDKEGPMCVPVCCGCFTLHQALTLSAVGPRFILGKAPSVEFADGGIDPLWISAKEPFWGAKKGAFGFKVTIKLVAEDCPEPEENGKEAIPAPKP